MFTQRLSMGVVFTWPLPPWQPGSVPSSAPILEGSRALPELRGWVRRPHVPTLSLPELDPHHEKHRHSRAKPAPHHPTGRPVIFH